MEITRELLVKFLTWAIEEEMRISGDYDGNICVSRDGDSYENIANDFIGCAQLTIDKYNKRTPLEAT
jgi:hypothetical protein